MLYEIDQSIYLGAGESSINKDTNNFRESKFVKVCGVHQLKNGNKIPAYFRNPFTGESYYNSSNKPENPKKNFLKVAPEYTGQSVNLGQGFTYFHAPALSLIDFDIKAGKCTDEEKEKLLKLKAVLLGGQYFEALENNFNTYFTQNSRGSKESKGFHLFVPRLSKSEENILFDAGAKIHPTVIDQYSFNKDELDLWIFINGLNTTNLTLISSNKGGDLIELKAAESINAYKAYTPETLINAKNQSSKLYTIDEKLFTYRLILDFIKTSGFTIDYESINFYNFKRPRFKAGVNEFKIESGLISSLKLDEIKRLIYGEKKPAKKVRSAAAPINLINELALEREVYFFKKDLENPTGNAFEFYLTRMNFKAQALELSGASGLIDLLRNSYTSQKSGRESLRKFEHEVKRVSRKVNPEDLTKSELSVINDICRDPEKSNYNPKARASYLNARGGSWAKLTALHVEKIWSDNSIKPPTPARQKVKSISASAALKKHLTERAAQKILAEKNHTKIFIEAGERLSDYKKVIYKAMKKSPVFIKSGTGTGKTYFTFNVLKEDLKKQGGALMMATPYRALTLQNYKQYGAYPFMGKSKDLTEDTINNIKAIYYAEIEEINHKIKALTEVITLSGGKEYIKGGKTVSDLRKKIKEKNKELSKIIEIEKSPTMKAAKELEAVQSGAVCAVYDSLKRALELAELKSIERAKSPFNTFVIDEAHNLATAHFRKRQVNEMLYLIELFKSEQGGAFNQIYLSATPPVPIEILKACGFHVIEFINEKQKATRKIDVKIIKSNTQAYAKESVINTINDFLKSGKATRKDTFVFRFNKIEASARGAGIKQLAEEIKNIFGFNALAVYSPDTDENDEAASAALKYMQSNNATPQNARVILCTDVIRDGLNLDKQRGKAHFIDVLTDGQSKNPVNTIQFFGRAARGQSGISITYTLIFREPINQAEKKAKYSLSALIKETSKQIKLLKSLARLDSEKRRGYHAFTSLLDEPRNLINNAEQLFILPDTAKINPWYILQQVEKKYSHAFKNPSEFLNELVNIERSFTYGAPEIIINDTPNDKAKKIDSLSAVISNLSEKDNFLLSLAKSLKPTARGKQARKINTYLENKALETCEIYNLENLTKPERKKLNQIFNSAIELTEKGLSDKSIKKTLSNEKGELTTSAAKLKETSNRVKLVICDVFDKCNNYTHFTPLQLEAYNAQKALIKAAKAPEKGRTIQAILAAATDLNPLTGAVFQSTSSALDFLKVAFLNVEKHESEKGETLYIFKDLVSAAALDLNIEELESLSNEAKKELSYIRQSHILKGIEATEDQHDNESAAPPF